jgi:hypothetical protein
MDIVAVWLVDFFYSAGLWYALYVGHTLPVTDYLFTLFLVIRPGMVALSVYRVSHVCGDVCNRSCFVL